MQLKPAESKPGFEWGLLIGQSEKSNAFDWLRVNLVSIMLAYDCVIVRAVLLVMKFKYEDSGEEHNHGDKPIDAIRTLYSAERKLWTPIKEQ